MDAVLGNRYRLLEIIGQGGMAVVYKAQDTVLGRFVAVKMLRPQYAADPIIVDRFHKEAQAAAGLSHPNIVNVYDVGQEDGRPYIVMEYVAGQSLKEIITAQGPLPIGDALDIAAQICAAVDFAHRHGLVHRDIKPQNVLISPEGLAKVADFGLAAPSPRAREAAEGEEAEVWGTVHYLSPEQAQGKPATQASDIYAIGVVLYEMVTGQVPFEGTTPEEVILKHLQQSPSPPHLLNPRVPAAVEAFILKAMAKDPERRYTSAREMGSAITAYKQMGEGYTLPYRPVVMEPTKATGRPTPVEEERSQPLPEREKASNVAGFDCLLAFLLLLSLACVLGLIPFGLYVRDALAVPTPTPLPEVAVPNLVGLELAVARSRLQALGLTLVQIGERYDDKVPAGHIVAQIIPPNTRVRWGEEIGVILSKGVELLPVPHVVGLPYTDALERVTKAGLSVRRLDATNPAVAAGLVMAQNPAANTPVQRGTVVTLTVSLGNKVVVPDLFAKPEAEAQQMIRDAGLSTTWVNYQGPEDIPASEHWRLQIVKPGHVLSQMPPAGTLVDIGTTVYLAIRK